MAGKESKRDSPEKNNRNQDITDSERDKERLSADTGSINLPDVKDIPGQEHIHVAPLGDIADTTISSDDEEGTGVFEDDEEDETIIVMGSEDDIPKEDMAALETMEDRDAAGEDEIVLMRGLPDDTDDEGEPLNERVNTSGSDLDTSGVDEDDANEEIGEEDEENNPYSLGSDREHESDGRE